MCILLLLVMKVHPTHHGSCKSTSYTHVTLLFQRNLYTNLCLKHGNGTETLHCKSLFLMDDAFTCFYIVSENSMPNNLFDVIYSKHQYHLTKKWLLGGKTTRGQLGNAHSDVWMVHHGKKNATAECHRPVRIQQLMFQRNWCLFSK